MILYDYWRSSASYRVRIALHMKGIMFDTVPINLVAGEQTSEEHLKRNPQGLVPALDLGDGTILTQSMAIIEYLEESCAGAPLLPKEPEARARVRAMANIIACDTHPLNNLRVLNHLTKELHVSEDDKSAWYEKWIHEAFTAIERMTHDDDQFLFGNTPTLADVCMIPQMYNAERFSLNVKDYKNIIKSCNNCYKQINFRAAHPDRYKPKP